MYTATVGKRLIQILNERNGTSFTPRTFFDEVYFPLFYRADRYLFDGPINSPVAQAISQQKRCKVTDEVLQTRRLEIHNNIAKGKRDCTVLVGSATDDLLGTSSGQVTALSRTVPDDDVYASWIGAGLGVTIEGGIILLFDEPEILLNIYEGWQKYRAFLVETPTQKANKINSWNGQWLTSRIGKGYIAGQKWSPVPTKDDALETQPWVQLIFALSWAFREVDQKTINTYAYKLGQTNTTGGFVRLNLPSVRRVSDLYNSLFTVPDGLPSKNFEDLYQTELSFIRAFQQGEIGIRALQPKDLRDLLEHKKQPKFTDTDAQKAFLFQIQQVWIIAMLNNNALITKAEDLAKILRGYAAQDQRLKKVNETQVNEVLASKARRDFITSLTNIIANLTPTSAEAINGLVTDIMGLPAENVPLFLALIRFKYAYLAVKPAALTPENI